MYECSCIEEEECEERGGLLTIHFGTIEPRSSYFSMIWRDEDNHTCDSSMEDEPNPNIRLRAIAGFENAWAICASPEFAAAVGRRSIDQSLYET